MSRVLIIVGDRGRARLFSTENRKDAGLEELVDLVNPEIRIHEGVLAGDRQGRSMNQNHGSRVALGEPHPHKRTSAERFANQVADAMECCCMQEHYTRIFLLAAPEFLGLLRPCLAERQLKTPVTEVHKDLTRQPVAAIRGHLPDYLH